MCKKIGKEVPHRMSTVFPWNILVPLLHIVLWKPINAFCNALYTGRQRLASL